MTRLLPMLLVPVCLSACRDAAPPPAATGAPEPVVHEPATAEPEPPQRRVLVIGVDGVDPAMVGTLAAAGKLPNLSGLMQSGAHGILYSEREIRSPALWTTMATGRPREVHGIYDFVTGSRLWPEDRRSEEQHLVTSNMRDVPAVWNLAGDAGLEVVVVGWLNTWPAERVNGVMVSPYVAIGQRKQITIKGTVYEDEARQVYPEERWPEIQALVVSAAEVPTELVNELAPPPPARLAELYPQIEKYRAAVRWSLAHTLTMKNVLLHLIETDDPQLIMGFFEGADSLGHRFWLFRQPVRQIKAQLSAAGLPVEGAAKLARLYGGVVERYYRVLDEVIGELLAAVGDDTLIIVASDHGFGSRSGRWKVKADVPFDGEHRLEGFVTLRAPGVEAGSVVYGATLYDIAPTILDALGVAHDLGLEGASLISTRRDRNAPQAPTEDAPIDSPFDDDEVARLRSLGYVQ